MQYVLFRLNAGLYAINATEIETILPVPELSMIDMAPDHVAGMFLYQGQLVPVLDLQILLGGKPCSRVYSSRVLLVREAGGAALGLLAEQLLDVLSLDREYTLDSKIQGTGHDWLDNTVLESGQGLVQRIRFETLFTPEIFLLMEKDGRYE